MNFQQIRLLWYFRSTTSTMARILIPTLALLLGFTSVAVAAHKIANNSTNSSNIAGDSDTYGLGVRLRVYIQWIATLRAVTGQLRIVPQIRTAILSCNLRVLQVSSSNIQATTSLYS
ncbi:hypothetical protein BGZ60DRAFT_256294 [Tricladium varicosporioides]|nr:hypothetical protein BGZ60DRAFT_256294 [Hymenoscyphus varicosporioides]